MLQGGHDSPVIRRPSSSLLLPSTCDRHSCTHSSARICTNYSGIPCANMRNNTHGETHTHSLVKSARRLARRTRAPRSRNSFEFRMAYARLCVHGAAVPCVCHACAFVCERARAQVSVCARKCASRVHGRQRRRQRRVHGTLWKLVLRNKEIAHTMCSYIREARARSRARRQRTHILHT